MTSEARERSWSDGQPIALFRFTRGNVSWYYTSADRDQVYLGETWTAAAIKRDSAIRQGSDSAQLSVKVSLPSTLPVAANWRPFPPSEPIVLTIFVRHHGETDALAEWVGRVVGPKFDGPLLTLTGEPSRTRARRQGNSPKWQRGCGSVLYGKGVGKCNLEPEIVPVPGVLSAVDGVVVTASGFAAAPRSLVGGRLEWLDALGVLQGRGIIAHAGQQVTLASGSADLVEALAVTAYTRSLYVEATVTALAGLTLTAAAFAGLPSGRLAGGFVRWARAADGLIEFRTIKAHAGNTITLDYGALDLAVDLVLRAYPGCAHNWADCGYHENRHNYGGDLWMPVKNPFDGNPVW